VLTLAMSSLIMLVLIHLSVFAVVRWMYPASPPQPQVRFAEPMVSAPPPPPFTEPQYLKQEVNVPTYASPVSVEAPREDGRADGGKAPSTAAERPAWLVAVDPKTLEYRRQGWTPGGADHRHG
jgi:hypothetical protein